jgi:uncharacterized protein (DUF433 family)
MLERKGEPGVTVKTFCHIFGYNGLVQRRKPVRKAGQDLREFPTYSLPEAASFLGIPERTLRSWFAGVDPILDPAATVGEFPILSFRNLVDAHIVQTARIFHGVPMHRIRTAIETAFQEGQTDFPLQDKNLRIFARCLVRIEPGRGRRKRAVVNLSRSGQTGIPEVVELYTRRVMKDEKGIPIALFPWRHGEIGDRTRPVSIDPNVMSGRLVVRGTRIPVSVLLLESRRKSAEQLARDYQLTPKVVREALSHFDSKAA